MKQQERDENTSSSDRTVFFTAAGAVLLILLCLALAGALTLLVDPFGWGLWDRLTGARQEALAAMPAETALYLGLDLLNLSEEELIRLSQPFLETLERPELPDFDSALDQLDAILFADLGLTFTDDIRPWLGRSVGLGFKSGAVDESGNPFQAGWILAVATLNREASDAFLDSLGTKLADRTETTVREEMYRGVSLSEVAVGSFGGGRLENIAFGRSGSLLLFGPDTATVREAVDAHKDSSWADEQDYRELAALMPDGRSLTAYVDGTTFLDRANELSLELPFGIDAASLLPLAFHKSALTAAIVDTGLQIDLLRLTDAGLLTEAQRLSLESIREAPESDSRLPDTTLIYIAGGHLDYLLAGVADSITPSSNRADFDESMALFGREFGLNPFTDFMPLLDGEWAIGILPSQEGLLTGLVDLPLGFVLLADSGRSAQLSSTVETLKRGLIDQRLSVDEISTGDLTVNSVHLPLTTDPLLAFGVANSWFLLGSDEGSVSSVLAEGGSLAESQPYREVWSEFPDDMLPTIYIDVRRLLGVVGKGLSGPEGDKFDRLAQLLQPVTVVASASKSTTGDVRRSTTIIFIEGMGN